MTFIFLIYIDYGSHIFNNVSLQKYFLSDLEITLIYLFLFIHILFIYIYFHINFVAKWSEEAQAKCQINVKAAVRGPSHNELSNLGKL